jgi:hypothetical protein
MAVIKPANVAPDAYPRVRGNVITRVTEHQIIVQKWPRKRGPSQTWKAQFLTQQFGIAGRMAANAEPMSWETAKYWSQGTVWMPRDILVMAAYGKLIEITGTDGTKFVQADHSAPATPTIPRPTVLQWQANAVQGVNAAGLNAAASAFKGTCFQPAQNMTMYAVSTVLTPINGAFYRACVATLNSSNVITALTLGPTKQIGLVTRRAYIFDCLANLTDGNRYAVMVGRTDGANNYVLPVPNFGGANWLFPCVELGNAALTSNSPAIGQTVAVGGNPFPQYMLVDY